MFYPFVLLKESRFFVKIDPNHRQHFSGFSGSEKRLQKDSYLLVGKIGE